VIDGYGKTNIPGIYAIGDVAGPPMLAHKANEGVICIERSRPASARHGQEPHSRCTYCNPQIASVGLTEARAKEAAARSASAVFRSSATARRSRSRGPGAGEGDLRQEDRQLLGAHMIARGHRADPGLCGGDESGDHRGRADAHRIPHPTLSR